MTVVRHSLVRSGWAPIVTRLLLVTILFMASSISRSSELSVDQRITNLIDEMTIEEKIGQMSRFIPLLGEFDCLTNNLQPWQRVKVFCGKSNFLFSQDHKGFLAYNWEKKPDFLAGNG